MVKTYLTIPLSTIGGQQSSRQSNKYSCIFNMLNNFRILGAHGLPAIIASQPAMKGSGSETTTRNHTTRGGIAGIS